VLDTLEMALWIRDHHGLAVTEGLVVHSDAGSQGGFNRSTQRIAFDRIVDARRALLTACANRVSCGACR
jgi:hypothetical protein